MTYYNEGEIIIKKLIFVLSLLVVFTACGNQKKETAKDTSLSTEQSKAVTKKTTNKEATETDQTSSTTMGKEKRSIDGLISEMTLAEKVGQLFLVRVPEINQLEDIQNYHLGGYLLFGRDIEGETEDSLKTKIRNYQSSSSEIPLFIASDEEGGTVSRLSSAGLANFQSPQTLYQSGGWDAIRNDVKTKAETFKNYGIQLGLYPIADVATDPQAFIYDRTIGMDAAGTSDYIKTCVEEMNQQRIGSTLKHFPGYGNNRDSHVEIVRDDRSLAELEENDFKPFEAGIKAGADSILFSHNIINAIDPTLPASISKPVHDIVRQQMGFDGVIMTDDMDMAGLADFISQEEAGLQALKAGNDLILSSSYSKQIPYILSAIESGDYSEAELNQSVKRVLEWKYKLGLI